MDAVVEPHVRELVMMWATQIGKSTAIENVVGYWAAEDPGNALLTMPNEESVKETIAERIKPMVEASPNLRDICDPDRDISANHVDFTTMSLYGAWATSPASLARRSCRYLLNDECDKFPTYAGKEGDPISLGRKRLQTYGHRRREISVSSPTTRNGTIYKLWELCGDRRFYFCPCPHCGEYQRLVWQQVKWEKLDIPDAAKRASIVQQGKLAWYECLHCKQRITDWHKPKMLAHGRWLSETQTIRKDGTVEGYRPQAASVGFHLSTIYSPWVTWPELVADFIKAQNDPGKTQDFYNSLLAEPFDNTVSKTQAGTIRKKSDASKHERGVVPSWATGVFATVDTQKDWFKVHIGAWGFGYRYQLVQEMTCQTFEEVYAASFATYPMEGSKVGVQPNAMLIDSGGSRTNEVYEFAQRDPGRIFPTKGSSHQMRRPFQVSQLEDGTVLRLIDTIYFKDMLNRLIHDQDESKWMPHREVSEQFCIEMASEHKIIERGKNIETWVKKTSGARVEAWDCETLQCAAAYMANLGAQQGTNLIEHKPDPQPAKAAEAAGFVSSWKGRY